MAWLRNKKTVVQEIENCGKKVSSTICAKCWFANCKRSIVYVSNHLDELLNQILIRRIAKGPIPEPIEIIYARYPIDISSFKIIAKRIEMDYPEPLDIGPYLIRQPIDIKEFKK
jgi:hypothetical protein